MSEMDKRNDAELAAMRADVVRMFHELQSLKDRITAFEQHSSAGSPAGQAAWQAPARAGQEEPVDAVVVDVPAAPSFPPASPAPTPVFTVSASPFAPARPGGTLKPPAARPAIDWESVVGGRWMTWIGAVVLILAIAFGVVWAWTTLDTPDWLRALAVHLLGAGFLGAAWFAARRKLPVLSQALAGLGIFTLFTAAFATLKWYDFMRGRESLVFVEGLLITALAIAIAVRMNAVAIILIGALGGYLTPIVTSTGSGQYVAMFVYLAFLNVALAGAAIAKGWSFIKPLTLAATALMFMLWMQGSSYDAARQRWPLEWLLVLHAAIMLAATTAPPLLWRRKSMPSDLAALAANSLWFMGMTWSLFHDEPTRQMALLSGGLALGHLALFAATWQRVTHADRMPRLHLALAAVFFTLAAPLQLEDASSYWGVTWCVEGLVFTAVGIYFRDRQMRVTALVVFAIAAIRVLVWDYLISDPASIGDSGIDLRFLMMLFVGVLAIGAGALYWAIPLGMGWERDDEHRRSWAGPGLLAAGNLMLLLALTCQWQGRIVLVLWTLDVAAIWVTGFYFDRPLVRWYACFIGVIMAGGRALFHNVQVDPGAVVLLNARFASLALLAVTYLAAGWHYRRLNQASRSVLTARRLAGDAGPAGGGSLDEAGGLDPVLGILGNVALVIALSLEIDLWFDQIGGRRGMAEMAAYSVLWAVYAAAVVAAGFALRYKLFRWIGIISFVPILGKVFIIDLGELRVIYRVLALAVVGVMLLGVSFLYQKFAQRLGDD